MSAAVRVRVIVPIHNYLIGNMFSREEKVLVQSFPFPGLFYSHLSSCLHIYTLYTIFWFSWTPKTMSDEHKQTKKALVRRIREEINWENSFITVLK